MKRIASIVVLIATTVLQLSARNKADLVLENNWTYYGNKAHQIRLATDFKAAGLQDKTCPPHTNFAGYNLLKNQETI